MGTMNVQITDEMLSDFKTLIDRGLNCWDPKEAPAWAFRLSDAVGARIESIAAAKARAPEGMELRANVERPDGVEMSIYVPKGDQS